MGGSETALLRREMAKMVAENGRLQSPGWRQSATGQGPTLRRR